MNRTSATRELNETIEKDFFVRGNQKLNITSAGALNLMPEAKQEIFSSREGQKSHQLSSKVIIGHQKGKN